MSRRAPAKHARPRRKHPFYADAEWPADPYSGLQRCKRCGVMGKPGDARHSDQFPPVPEDDVTARILGEREPAYSFDLALRVFDGADVADAVTARLRYRIDSDGRLALMFILDQLTDVVNAAFEGVIESLKGGVGEVPILRGTPA